MLDIMQNYESIRQVIHDVTLMNNRFLNKALDGNIPATQRMLRMVRNLMLKYSEVTRGRRKREHASIVERWICIFLIPEKSTRLYQRPM